MKRAMVLTVGTSLYHSATWNHAGPLEKIEGYGSWLGDRYLGDPNARHQDGIVGGRLGEGLDATRSTTEISAWADVLPEELVEEGSIEEPMRYSAELATLIKLEPETSLRQLLRSFEAIYLPCDPVTTAVVPEARRSYVAARHLKAYLDRIAGDGSRRVHLWEIAHLAETKPLKLLPALKDLRRWTKDLRDGCDRLDLVVTGGYKVYGYVLTALVTEDEGPEHGARLRYLYEGSNELVTLDARHIRMGHQTVELVPGGYPDGGRP